MKLLLLEDDDVLRDELAGRLRRSGFGVVVTTTLADARFQIDVGHYDCLVLDRTVPDEPPSRRASGRNCRSCKIAGMRRPERHTPASTNSAGW